MSKINTFIPEPKEEYNIENQRLINLAITQIIQKLNFSYQQEIKNDQQAFEYFLSWQYSIKTKDTNKLIQAKQQCLLVLLMQQ